MTVNTIRTATNILIRTSVVVKVKDQRSVLTGICGFHLPKEFCIKKIFKRSFDIRRRGGKAQGASRAEALSFGQVDFFVKSVS